MSRTTENPLYLVLHHQSLDCPALHGGACVCDVQLYVKHGECRPEHYAFATKNAIQIIRVQ